MIVTPHVSVSVSVLFGGEVVDAQATYADCSEVPNFQSSEEQKTAYALLNAYRDADVEAVKSAVAKSASVGFLEAPFARVAKKLPKPGHDLKAMSIRMGGSGGVIAAGEGFLGSGGGGGDDENEDDLT